MGVKRLGHGVDHPPPSSDEVKEIVELSTPLLGLQSRLYGAIYLHLYYNQIGSVAHSVSQKGSYQE